MINSNETNEMNNTNEMNKNYTVINTNIEYKAKGGLLMYNKKENIMRYFLIHPTNRS